MRPRTLLLLASIALAVGTAGCSSSAAAPRTVAIVMTDAMTFEPADITVRQGETVRFDVKNVGQIAHEFYIGDAADQDSHEAEMKKFGAMRHDHENGVNVDGGASKPLIVTFKTAGTFLIGCHEPGHWTAGMKGTIVVQP